MRIFSPSRSGQVMMLTVMVLTSAVVFSSIVMATLVLFQMRQTISVVDSTRAAYAADAGIECELYQIFGNIPGFTCDQSAGIVCSTGEFGSLPDDAVGPFCDLTDAGGNSLGRFRIATSTDPGGGLLPVIKSVGEYGRATRAFEATFRQI